MKNKIKLNLALMKKKIVLKLHKYIHKNYVHFLQFQLFWFQTIYQDLPGK